MAILSISGCRYALATLHESAYQLDIFFTDDTKAVVSRKQFMFTYPAVGSSSGRLWDVASINGKTSETASSRLFSKADTKDIEGSLSRLSELGGEGPTILVLDVKNPEYGYLPDDGSIARAEDDVCAFFSAAAPPEGTSKTAKKVHALFQEHRSLNYLLREGSLKSDLLRSGAFSEPEVAFFQANTIGYCQCAEYFMNGVKFGHGARRSSGEFLLLDYVKPIGIDTPAFSPVETSSVFYPPLYREVYAVDGPFMESLKPVFSISGGCHEETGITMIHVEAGK